MYVRRGIVWNRNSKHRLGYTGRKDWREEDCRSSRRIALVAADLSPLYRFQISAKPIKSLLEMLMGVSYVWESFARVSLELQLTVDESARLVSKELLGFENGLHGYGDIK